MAKPADIAIVGGGLVGLCAALVLQHPSRRVEIIEAGHPIPDDNGLKGARRIIELLTGLDEKTLVFCLMSGGGSALLPLPAEGISLAEKQRLTGLLLEAGADIGEINTIRKHMSAAKGGQLARAAAPATLVNLILSDVVGDRLDVIASGPTVPDASTFADAELTARVVSPEQIQRARRSAPALTPATMRGHYIREFALGDEPIAANWKYVIIGQGWSRKFIRLAR